MRPYEMFCRCGVPYEAHHGIEHSFESLQQQTHLEDVLRTVCFEATRVYMPSAKIICHLRLEFNAQCFVATWERQMNTRAPNIVTTELLLDRTWLSREAFDIWRIIEPTDGVQVGEQSARVLAAVAAMKFPTLKELRDATGLSAPFIEDALHYLGKLGRVHRSSTLPTTYHLDVAPAARHIKNTEDFIAAFGGVAVNGRVSP